MKIAGIVLAGGLSSRMGQDKAQLLLAQQTLLERAVNMLEQLKLEVILVSGDYPSFQSIADIHQNIGPLGGLHACVEKLYGQYDGIFVLPVDMPLISTFECQQLLEYFTLHPSGVFFEQATFPMILPLNKILHQYLSEVLLSPHKKYRSLYRLIKTLNIQPVQSKPQQGFRFKNTNTPEEWSDCQKTYKELQTYKSISED